MGPSSPTVDPNLSLSRCLAAKQQFFLSLMLLVCYQGKKIGAMFYPLPKYSVVGLLWTHEPYVLDILVLIETKWLIKICSHLPPEGPMLMPLASMLSVFV